MSSMRVPGLRARSHQPEPTFCVEPLGSWRRPVRYAPPIVVVIVVVLSVMSPPGQVAGVLYALATVLALAGIRESLA